MSDIKKQYNLVNMDQANEYVRAIKTSDANIDKIKIERYFKKGYYYACAKEVLKDMEFVSRISVENIEDCTDYKIAKLMLEKGVDPVYVRKALNELSPDLSYAKGDHQHLTDIIVDHIGNSFKRVEEGKVQSLIDNYTENVALSNSDSPSQKVEKVSRFNAIMGADVNKRVSTLSVEEAYLILAKKTIMQDGKYIERDETGNIKDSTDFKAMKLANENLRHKSDNNMLAAIVKLSPDVVGKDNEYVRKGTKELIQSVKEREGR